MGISTISRRALLASTFLIPAALAFADTMPLYRNAAAPIEARVRDLLARMTLEEKVAQMRCLWISKGAILGADGNVDPVKARAAIANGIGQIARPSDMMGVPGAAFGTHRTIEGTIAFVNSVQRFLVEQTRLGIPALFHEETAHGYVAQGATIFPIPPALASTWNTDLVEQAFAVTGREARIRGATVALSPVIDLMREPRFGRSEEFFSEDPYLTAQMGIASVRGQQGRTRPLGPTHVYCTLKHFVHGSPAAGLNIAPAEMSDRTLRENYLVPFAQAIRVADAAIVMPSYNEVEGVPSHANAELLQRTGRNRLGFRGPYFSDYGGVANLATQHHIAANADEAAMLALNAGVDADLPDGENYARLPDLVRAGRVAETQIDAAATRILALKFEAGLFENPYTDAHGAARNTNTAEDIRLARTVAEKALILLKNDGVLPLDPGASMKLAVIGPNAEAPLLGGYSADNAKSIGILAGVRAAAGPHIQVTYAEGVQIVKRNTSTDPMARFTAPSPAPPPPAENAPRIAVAVDLARRSDVVLLVVGDDPSITHETTRPTAPGDRNALDLFGQQDELAEALLATGKPVIALLLNGRPLATNLLAARANALLEGWYLGQEGGNAFARVLFGAVNPGGKLTVSVPRSVGDLPVFYNHHPSAQLNHFVEGDHTPLYPFGYGLSYTTFDVSAPRIDRDRIGRNESFALSVDVTNTGRRTGDEVVQIYVRDDVSSVPRPILELKAFKRVTLNAGEMRTLRFELSPDDLAFWNIDMQWLVEPGTFTISAGSSSASLKAASLTVT